MEKDPYTFYRIIKPTPDVTSSGYEGVYDAQPHGITVVSDGSTITYSEDGITFSSVNPMYTNAGTYTVYFKVEKTGYQTVTESETIQITKATPVLLITEDTYNELTVYVTPELDWHATTRNSTTGCSIETIGEHTVKLKPGGRTGETHSMTVIIEVYSSTNYKRLAMSNTYTWDGSWNRTETGWTEV